MEHESAREIRKNVVTGRHVVMAPHRGRRPRETEKVIADEAPDKKEACPFCPGNEDQLAGIIDEQPARDGRPWQTRVVPNKYAALTESPPASTASNGLFTAAPAYGWQEVIIETPEHNRDLVDCTEAEVEAVLAMYQQRICALRDRDDTLVPFVFRNYGARAGASLSHPHSQVIAMAQRPPDVEAEVERARAHFDKTGQCLYCDLVTHEADGPRVVWTSDHIVAFVPFAAEVPYEVMLLPRGHRADVAIMDDAVRADMARGLRQVLRGLRTACGDPDYNFYLRTFPAAADDGHLHWYLRLCPRITVRAGFELSTGLRINPSLPRADAARLRMEG